MNIKRENDYIRFRPRKIIFKTYGMEIMGTVSLQNKNISMEKSSTFFTRFKNFCNQNLVSKNHQQK